MRKGNEESQSNLSAKRQIHDYGLICTMLDSPTDITQTHNVLGTLRRT